MTISLTNVQPTEMDMVCFLISLVVFPDSTDVSGSICRFKGKESEVLPGTAGE